MIQLPSPLQFDWDEGNRDKNRRDHDISCEEAEYVFFDPDLIVRPDFVHSGEEKRYFAYGENEKRKKLLIAFTLRNERIRIISARRANEREIKKYESIRT